jgi:hypothetical protein
MKTVDVCIKTTAWDGMDYGPVTGSVTCGNGPDVAYRGGIVTRTFSCQLLRKDFVLWG